MTILICLPLILVVVGLAARRWFVTTRQDIRSIQSHRSAIGHLEHLAPGEAPAGSVAGSAHVRIVGQAAGETPAVRPMVWGRPDGRTPAARPAWHAARAAGARARYEKARLDVEAEVRNEDRPTIVITDSAVTGLPDAEPGREAPARRTGGRRPTPPAAPERAGGRRPTPAPAAEPAVARPTPPPAAEPAVARPTPPPAVEPAVARPTPPPAVEPAVARPTPPPAAEPSRSRRHRRPRRGGHRSSRVLGTVAALAVVVAAGAAVAVEQLQPRGSAHGAVHSAARPAGPVPTTAPPISTVPAPTTPPTLAATSTSATEAVYSVAAGSLDVSLAASAPCWVELRTGSPAGPIAYEGTVPAGTTQNFSAGNGLWLRLGDPAAVQLTINGAVVNLPAAANPFNVTVTSA